MALLIRDQNPRAFQSGKPDWQPPGLYECTNSQFGISVASGSKEAVYALLDQVKEILILRPRGTMTKGESFFAFSGKPWDSFFAFSGKPWDSFSPAQHSGHELVALQLFSPESAERIDYVANLELNWDGYGSNTISRPAIDACVNLLMKLARGFYSHFEQPFIAPMADGGLELEWTLPSQNELSLVFPPEGSPVRFLVTIYHGPVNPTFEEGIIPTSSTTYGLPTHSLV